MKNNFKITYKNSINVTKSKYVFIASIAFLSISGQTLFATNSANNNENNHKNVVAMEKKQETKENDLNNDHKLSRVKANSNKDKTLNLQANTKDSTASKSKLIHHDLNKNANTSNLFDKPQASNTHNSNNVSVKTKTFYTTALGDSYQSAKNPVIKDTATSFHDFISQDLTLNGIKNSNINHAQSGETLSQSLMKIGVDKTKINTYGKITPTHDLTSKDKSPEQINKVKQDIKNSDVVYISAGGNDIMSLIKIFDVKLVDALELINSKHKQEFVNDFKKLEQEFISKNPNYDGQSDNKVRDLIKLLMNKDISQVLHLGSNGASITADLLKSKDILGDLKKDSKFSDFVTKFELILKDQKLLIDSVKKINPNAKIVFVNYANPYSHLGQLGAQINNLFNQLIVQSISKNLDDPSITFINTSDINGFRQSDTNNNYINNIANVFDIHPSAQGHQNIAQYIEKVLFKKKILNKELVNNNLGEQLNNVLTKDGHYYKTLATKIMSNFVTGFVQSLDKVTANDFEIMLKSVSNTYSHQDEKFISNFIAFKEQVKVI